MEEETEKLFKKQLDLLSEQSSHCEDNSLADITLAMLEICRYLDPI